MPHPERAKHPFAVRLLAILLASAVPACAWAQAAGGGEKPTLTVRYKTDKGCQTPALSVFGGTSFEKLNGSPVLANAKTPRITKPSVDQGIAFVEIEFEIKDPAPFLTPPIRIAFPSSTCPLRDAPEVTLKNVGTVEKLETCVASPIFWAGAANCKDFGAQRAAEAAVSAEATTSVPGADIDKLKQEAEARAQKEREDKEKEAERLRQLKAEQERLPAETAAKSFLAELLAMPAAYLLLMLCAAVYLLFAVILGLTDMVRARHTRRFMEDQRKIVAGLADQVNAIRDDLAQVASPPPPPPPPPPPVAVPPPPPEPPTTIIRPPAAAPPDDRETALQLPPAPVNPVGDFTRAYRTQILTRARAETLVELYGITGYDRHPDNSTWLVQSPKDVMGDLNFWALAMDDGTCLVCPSYYINVDLFSLTTADGLGARRLFGDFFDVEPGSGELRLERPALMRRVNDRILEIVQRGRISL